MAAAVPLSRAFVYQVLARAYENPTPESWTWLATPATRAGLCSALRNLDSGARSALADAAEAWIARLPSTSLEEALADYAAIFGHAARGSCPANEIEYGDLKADPLFQPHRLADLAAFYRAFGMDLTSDAAERQDHICLEAEFLSVLAAKEAYASAQPNGSEHVTLCRDAQKLFLREHWGRWVPAFASRLAKAAGPSCFGLLAQWTRAFTAADCARFGVNAGSDDLVLRPVDLSAESLCASCGLSDLPPGALRTT